MNFLKKMLTKIFLVILIISILFIITLSCDKEDVKKLPEKVYSVSLMDPTLEELNNFYEDKYTIINGDLKIQNIAGLTNLHCFSNLTSITGSITIIDNKDLISLVGLEGLQGVNGDLWIEENGNIKSLLGLENISYVTGYFKIRNTRELLNLDALSSIVTVGSDFYINAVSLKNINGLVNLTTVGGSFSLAGHPKITNLEGLNNLGASGGFIVEYNPTLVDFCAVKGLSQNSGITGPVHIRYNGYNPSSTDMINGNCSNLKGLKITSF